MNDFLITFPVFFKVATLASWRIAKFIAEPVYSGPWGILDSLRHFIGIEYNERSEMVARNEFAKAFSCIECAPIWLMIAFVALYLIIPTITTIILVPFAAGTVSVIVEGLLS